MFYVTGMTFNDDESSVPTNRGGQTDRTTRCTHLVRSVQMFEYLHVLSLFMTNKVVGYFYYVLSIMIITVEIIIPAGFVMVY